MPAGQPLTAVAKPPESGRKPRGAFVPNRGTFLSHDWA
jgi:hypothetical protein